MKGCRWGMLSLSALLLAAPVCPERPRVVVHEEGALDGYTLVSTRSLTTVELRDMEGRVVHSWDLIGFPAKLFPGGNILGSLGVGEGLETVEVVEKTWGGARIFSFSDWDGGSARQHHDYQREGNPVGYYTPALSFLPEGKTLVLANLDRLVPEVSEEEIKDDVVYEVDWEGTLSPFVWRAADHIDEFGFDEAARAALKEQSGEWLAINSMSRLGPNRWFEAGDRRFAPENILLSSRLASFLVIIDHETGGVVWRVGPDFASGPEAALGQFQGQHHAHLIPEGLPGAGNVLLFDNGAPSGYGGPFGYPKYPARHYSRVVEFDPVTLEIVWEYGPRLGEAGSFYSEVMSSAQRLPNGNTLVSIGGDGTIFEITPEKRIVWEYRDTDLRTSVYRAYRLPPEWLPEGFNPGGYAPWSKR